MSTEAAALTGVWTDDKVHSSIRYEIQHNGVAPYRGSFSGVEATLEYGDDGVKIKGTVDLTSVDLKDEQQRGHVLSPDFFDAERYPTASYESTKIEIDGQEVTVHGDLTLKGQSHPLTITGIIGEPSANAGGTESIPVVLDGVLSRSQHGIDWNVELPNGKAVLGDIVKLELALEFVKA
ncbi:MAG: YceI family protein [Solirubrobacterales bacterium]